MNKRTQVQWKDSLEFQILICMYLRVVYKILGGPTVFHC